MRADDFLVGIIRYVECQGWQGAYFQAALGAFDIFTELVVVVVIATENPDVRVTIQPRQKHAPFDVAAQHANLVAIEKVRSLDIFRSGGSAQYIHTIVGLGGILALVAQGPRIVLGASGCVVGGT